MITFSRELKDEISLVKIGPKGLSYCVYWRAAAAAAAAAAAIVSPVNKIFVEALLTGEWQTVCSLIVRSRPYRSTTKVVCL